MVSSSMGATAEPMGSTQSNTKAEGEQQRSGNASPDLVSKPGRAEVR